MEHLLDGVSKFGAFVFGMTVEWLLLELIVVLRAIWRRLEHD